VGTLEFRAGKSEASCVNKGVVSSPRFGDAVERTDRETDGRSSEGLEDEILPFGFFKHDIYKTNN